MDKKPIPHNERKYTRCKDFKVERTKPEEKRFTQRVEIDPKLGRMMKKAEYKVVDRVAEMEHFKVSDFSLENLLAVNAKLVPAQLSGNTFENLQRMESALEDIAASQSQTETKTE